MRVAQRELKVKVTADIDKSLTKLLDSLKKTVKVNVKVNVQGNELDKVKKTIDTLGKGKISSNVKVNVQSGELDKVQKDINKLGSSKTSASVDVKANSAGLDGLQKEMDGIERKAEEVSNARISPIGVAAGLAPLAVTLDQLSDKILQISQQTIAPVFKDALDASRELYDQQTAFMKQFKADGVGDKQIENWIKDLSGYAQESIFDTDQLMGLFSTFEGSGMDDSMGITKALAGITSMAPNVNTALDRVGRQFKQFTKDGNVYTRDWNAIRDAIGGVAANKLNDWFKKNKGIELVPESFAKGAVSVKDFTQAVKEVGGSDMFQGLAKNTDTISGAMAQFRETLRNTLLGDQYDPGPLRSVFDGIVQGLKDVTDEIPAISKDLSKGLEFIKKTFGEAFKDFSVKDFFDGLRDSFKGVAPVIQTIAKALALITNNGKNTGKLVGNLIKFAAGWKLFRGLAQPVFSLASAGRTLLGVAKSMGAIKEGGFLGKLFGGMGAGSKGSKSFNAKAIKGQALNAAKNIAIIAGVIGTVWAGAKTIESISKMEIDWGSLGNNLSATAVGLTAAGGYMAIIGTALDKIKGLKKNLATGGAAVAGVAGVLAISAKAIEVVSKVKINKNAGKNLAVMAGIITVAGGAMALIGTALTKFPQVALGLAAGAVAFLGISATLAGVSAMMESVVKNTTDTAKQLGKLNEVDLGSITGGIAKLGLVQGAFQALSVITLPTAAISALSNSLSLIGNAAQSLNISTLKSLVDKLNSFEMPDMDKLKEKLGKLAGLEQALAIEGLSSLPSKIASFASGMAGLAGAVGNLGDLAWLNTLTSFIKKLNDTKIPDTKSLKSKISKLKTIADTLSSDGEGGLVGVVKNIWKIGENLSSAVSKGSEALDITAALAPLKSLLSFVKNLNKLSIDEGSITSKISSLKDLATSISEFKLPKGATDVSKDLKTFTGNLSKITESLAKISEAGDLSNVGNTLTQVNTAMASITPIADSISSMNLPKGSKKKTSNLSEIVKSISSIAKSLAKISEIGDLSALEPSLTALQTNIDKIKPIIEKLAGLKLAKGSKNKVDSISDIVTSIKTIADTLNSFPEVPDISPRIESITNALNALTSAQGDSKISLFSFVETLGEDAKGSKLEDLVTFINDLATIANNLIALPEVPDLTAKFTSIQNALEKIKALQTKLAGDSKGGFAEGLKNAGKNISLESMVNTVNQLVKIANSLILIPEVPDMTAKIASIQNALTKIKGLQTALAGDENSAFAGGMANAEKSMSLSSMVNTVNQIIQIANALVLIPEVPDVTAKIQSVKNAVLQIKSLQTALAGDSKGGFAEALANKGNSISLEGMITQAQNVTSLVNAINAIPEVAEGITEKINAIKEAIKSLMSIGTAAVADAEGGSPVAGLQALLAQVNSILGQLKALTGQFQSTGTSYAQSLVNGFTSGGLERIPAKMNEIKAQLDGMADLTAIGRKMSDTLASGFDAKGLINQINDIQAAIDSLKGKTVTITIKEVKQKADDHNGGMIAERYNGGQIPEYHSTGGRVGERMKGKLSWFSGNRASGPSTDTVPAMLTPGEYVLKRSVANALGKGFLDALNTMNLNSAMAHLQNKVAGNVTNNTYNNITQNVDNKASYLNGLGSIRRVVRS